jgi:hypothetical protein
MYSETHPERGRRAPRGDTSGGYRHIFLNRLSVSRVMTSLMSIETTIEAIRSGAAEQAVQTRSDAFCCPARGRPD